MTAEFYINHLELLPHPEGGYYKETYRSNEKFGGAIHEFPSGRNYCTAIYYLLEKGDHSAFHKIKSDECWHHYEGGSLWIHIIHPNGKYECITLGKAVDRGEVFQFTVPANAWFGAKVEQPDSYTLSGCTVAPGFDFKDFEIADRKKLLQEFPNNVEIITELTV